MNNSLSEIYLHFSVGGTFKQTQAYSMLALTFVWPVSKKCFGRSGLILKRPKTVYLDPATGCSELISPGDRGISDTELMPILLEFVSET